MEVIFIKKLLSIILVFILTFSLTIPTFAVLPSYFSDSKSESKSSLTNVQFYSCINYLDSYVSYTLKINGNNLNSSVSAQSWQSYTTTNPNSLISFSISFRTASGKPDAYVYCNGDYIGIVNYSSPLTLSYDFSVDLFDSGYIFIFSPVLLDPEDFTFIYFSTYGVRLNFQASETSTPVTNKACCIYKSLTYDQGFFCYVPSLTYSLSLYSSGYVITNNNGYFTEFGNDPVYYVNYVLSQPELNIPEEFTIFFDNTYLLPLGVLYTTDDASIDSVEFDITFIGNSYTSTYHLLIPPNLTNIFGEFLVGTNKFNSLFIDNVIVHQSTNLPLVSFYSHLLDPFVYFSSNLSSYSLTLVFLFSILSILVIIFVLVFIFFRIRKGKG